MTATRFRFFPIKSSSGCDLEGLLTLQDEAQTALFKDAVRTAQ
jgi:hypothetical protein